MSPEVNQISDRAVTRALDDYADSLRAERPSQALDDRMEAAIAGWAAEHRSRSFFRRPLPWVVAVVSVAVVTGGIALLAAGRNHSDAEVGALVASTSLPPLSAGAAVSPLSTGGQVSLFPADGAVFRVKASLASAVLQTSGQKDQGERQYWVDVRIANDGTMRIMQVLPAERGRVLPRE